MNSSQKKKTSKSIVILTDSNINIQNLGHINQSTLKDQRQGHLLNKEEQGHKSEVISVARSYISKQKHNLQINEMLSSAYQKQLDNCLYSWRLFIALYFNKSNKEKAIV